MIKESSSTVRVIKIEDTSSTVTVIMIKYPLALLGLI